MPTTDERHRGKRNEYIISRDMMSTKATAKYANECLMHLERTLDEAYFPGLAREELSARNADQIASRSYVGGKTDLPIVIVPQLWLWHFNDCLISAHGLPRESEGWVFDPVRGLWGTPDYTGSPRYIMAKLIYRYVKSFGSEGTELSISITSTGKIYSEMKVQTEQKMKLKRDPMVDQSRSKDPKSEKRTAATVSGNELKSGDEIKPPTETPPTLDLFERQTVQVLSNVKKYMNETKRNQILYQEERGFHHDLSDCRSELAMIQYILDQQTEILIAFRADVEKEIEGDSPDAKLKQTMMLIDEATMILQGYDRKIRKIDGDAEGIEKNVQDLLNLKRTFAGVQDSHASVLLGLAAGAFAVVTIIFAPLAFLTALFALRVQGFESLWVEDSSQNASSSTVGGGATTSASEFRAIYDRRWLSLILSKHSNSRLDH